MTGAATASEALRSFVEAYGAEGPVCVAGAGQHWDVGGLPDAGTRRVGAPGGVGEHRPAEMTIRVGAGTTLQELDEHLAAHGQRVGLEGPPTATVGGVLAVGRGGLRRRRFGPPRDAVLEIDYASAEGRLVVAGGPTVKNVSGYDLCRLLVGSLGTLGGIGEVILRTQPRPACATWFAGATSPWPLERALYRPSSVLWDGETTWVLLEGHAADVAAQARALGDHGLTEVDGPPDLPPHRRSWPPAALASPPGPPGSFIAEIGVGIVHQSEPPPPVPVTDAVRRLHDRIKAAFDPRGRCNPGRDPLAAPGVTAA